MTRYDKMVASKTVLNAALDELEAALEGDDDTVTAAAFTAYE